MRVPSTYTLVILSTHRTVQLSFPFAVFQVFSHVCHAIVTDGSRNAGHTCLGHTPTLARFTGYEAFTKPPPGVLLLTTFGKPKPSFEWCMTDAVSNLLHAQYRLSLPQWNAGAARRRTTQLVTAMCGAFIAVLLQEDHDPHISDQFNTYSDDGGLAILLNKDTFLPDAVKYYPPQ